MGIQRRAEGHSDFFVVDVEVTVAAVAVAVAGADEFNSCAIALPRELDSARLRPSLKLINWFLLTVLA